MIKPQQYNQKCPLVLTPREHGQQKKAPLPTMPLKEEAFVVAYVVVCILVDGMHDNLPIGVDVRRRLLLLAVISAVSCGNFVLFVVRPVVLAAFAATSGSSCILTPNPDLCTDCNSCR